MTPFFPLHDTRLDALRVDNMRGLAQHPLCGKLTDDQLCLIEALARYTKDHSTQVVDLEYVRAFVMLADLTPEKVRTLAEALRTFGRPIAGLFDAVAQEIDTAQTRPRIHKGPRRSYERVVSLPPEELPDDWQAALRDMRNGIRRGIDVPAPSIQTRMV